MRVLVEMTTRSDRLGNVHAQWLRMSRVPSVDEVIRILTDQPDGLTKACWFRVERVEHNASTDEYPRRGEEELDAWIYCERCAEPAPASSRWIDRLRR